MFKKILILFLCFWISCGSVFAMNRRNIFDDNNEVEGVGEMEGENNNRIAANNVLDEYNNLINQQNEILRQHNNILRQQANNNARNNGLLNILKQFALSIFNGFGFAIGGSMFNHFFPQGGGAQA